MNDRAEPSDESLMIRLRDGEDLALNALMERWEKPLLGFVMRHTGNYADAVDLAQETFVRIYESRKRYRPKAKFSTWMFTIAANLCRNHARWKSRHPSVSMAEETGEGMAMNRTESNTDTGSRPDASAMLEDEASQVRAAVQELPADLRTAVLLFEFEGLAQAEIGTVLGCTRKAVETRLYRAKQLLRQKLSGLLSDLEEQG